MGISLWLLWDRTASSARRTTALVLFLALNAAWAFVFFAMHQVLAALIIILAMDVITAVLIARIWPLHRVSAILLVPYLAWISYATWHQCRDLVA